MLNPRHLIVLAAGAVACCSAYADESMRCGKWVVDSSATTEELLEKCGEPTSKEIKESDVRGPSPVGHGRVVVGKTVTERWTYDRGSRAFRMVVTVVDGKLKSIARAE